MISSTEIYDEKYERSDSPLNERQRYVVWHLDKNTEMAIEEREILEIGCGSGILAKQLSDHGATVTGVEVSSSGVKATRSKGIECFKADLSSGIPNELEEKSFNTIILVEVLEHVFDHIQLLASINGLLQEGGELILTTPNSVQYRRLLKYAAGRSPTGTQNATHVRFYSEKYLVNLLETQGFEIGFVNGISTKKRLSRVIPNRYFPTLFISGEKVEPSDIESIGNIFNSKLTAPEHIFDNTS